MRAEAEEESHADLYSWQFSPARGRASLQRKQILFLLLDQLGAKGGSDPPLQQDEPAARGPAQLSAPRHLSELQDGPPDPCLGKALPAATACPADTLGNQEGL